MSCFRNGGVDHVVLRHRSCAKVALRQHMDVARMRTYQCQLLEPQAIGVDDRLEVQYFVSISAELLHQRLWKHPTLKAESSNVLLPAPSGAALCSTCRCCWISCCSRTLAVTLSNFRWANNLDVVSLAGLMSVYLRRAFVTFSCNTCRLVATITTSSRRPGRSSHQL